MDIRPARADDFDAVAALTNHYITHTVIHFSTEPVTAAELRSAWETNAASYPFLVAHDSGRFAGFAKAALWRERRAYSWTTETGIYVTPELHARGVGTALYRALLQDLRDRGFHSVVAGVTLPNDPSVRLHEKLGFVSVGRVRRAGWKFGAWHDVGFWQLMLREPSHVPG